MALKLGSYSGLCVACAEVRIHGVRFEGYILLYFSEGPKGMILVTNWASTASNLLYNPLLLEAV